MSNKIDGFSFCLLEFDDKKHGSALWEKCMRPRLIDAAWRGLVDYYYKNKISTRVSVIGFEQNSEKFCCSWHNAIIYCFYPSPSSPEHRKQAVISLSLKLIYC